MNAVAIAYLTKDRVELSKQTILPLLGQPFDLHWFDGSTEAAAQDFPCNYGTGNFELHQNVRGGPDAAVAYALTTLLNHENDYTHIGICENDVLLQSGWFEQTMELFNLGDRDDLPVGAVSPRCFEDRILIQRDDYAVCHNLGWGCQIMTREAVHHALSWFRTGHTLENRRVFAQLTGLDLGRWWAFRAGEHNLCADWTNDWKLASQGLASLALTPSPVEMLGQVPPLAEQGLTIAAAPVEALRNDAAFEVFADRARKLQNCNLTLDAPFAYPDTAGASVYFSHQLPVLNALYLGDWRLAWNMGFGPFPYKAGDECSVTVQISGSCQVLLSGGADGGQFLIEDMQSGYSNDPVLSPEAQTGILGVMVPAGVACRDVRITALKPGGRFYGIKTFEPQASNPTWKFDHSQLPLV